MKRYRPLLPLLIMVPLLTGWSARTQAANPPSPLKPGEHIEHIYGPAYLVAHGWRLPPPPYPERALRFREQGSVYLHIETDKTGRVIKTSVLRTPLNTDSKTLRQLVVLWTLYKWSGPPNTSTNVEFLFRFR